MLVILGTFGIFCMIFCFTHFLSYSCNTPVTYCIFHGERSGLNYAIGRKEFLLQDIRNGILLFECGTSLHCLECFFVVESVESFQDRIRNNWHGTIAWHTFGFAIVQGPNWQLVLLAINGKHGIDNTVYFFRLSECHQRLQGTISIPQRKRGIVFLGWRGINHVVHTTVFAIHITISRRSNHRVIMGGIENTLIGFILTFHNHLLQLLVPTVCTSLHYLVEIPMCQFGLHVHGCILTTYGRKGNLNLYLLYITKGQGRFQIRSFPLFLRFRRITVVGCKVCHLLVGFQYEVHLAVRTPVVAIAITFNGIIVYFAYITHLGLGVRVTFVKIDQDRSRLTGWISITMKTYTVGSSHFCLDVVSFYQQ